MLIIFIISSLMFNMANICSFIGIRTATQAKIIAIQELTSENPSNTKSPVYLNSKKHASFLCPANPLYFLL
ncbi:hypothetical protein D3Z58_15600 [Clostridiaceae bacterium]|nr:hypothetical protein [Clostridiaceae bacterium]